MTGRTHDLGAFTALVIVVMALPQMPQMSLITAFVAFGANFMGGLFPDIDQTTSDFWDNFRWGHVISKIICPILGGHRNMSHSIIGLGVVGFLSHLFLQLCATIILIDMNIVWAAFMIGVISHYVLDTFTREGMPLFWPLKHKVGIPPWKSLRMEAGGFWERFIVFPGLLILSAYLMYHNQGKMLAFLHQYIR